LGVDADCKDGDSFVTSFFGADEKRDRSCGDSLSIAMRDCFFILSDRPLGVGVTFVEVGVDIEFVLSFAGVVG